MTNMCPGHIGRGTGTQCLICNLTIPADLRRAPGSPSEVRSDCVGCLRGRNHTHVTQRASST